MKYLYWRGNSLWCRYPIPGKPEMYPLGIHTTGTPADIKRCMAEGEKALAKLRTMAVEGAFFDIKKPEKEPKTYNPKYWRILGRYWYYHLRFTKSGKHERPTIKLSLKAFGARYARQIYREDIQAWRENLRHAQGYEVSTVNAAFKYLGAAYRYACSENNPRYRFDYNPVSGMKKMPGEKIRTFLLTPELFERNYATLRDGVRWNGRKPNKHMTGFRIAPSPRFALFYLALWETGRRPVEVSQYRWEMVVERPINGVKRYTFMIPPEITKTAEPAELPISERLWREMSQLGYRHGYVFRNEDGNRWKNWKRHMGKLKALYGDTAGWARDTRRGFITRKVEIEGFAPAHVKEVSGHKTYSTFDRYRIGQLSSKFGVIDGVFRTNGVQFQKNDEKVAKLCEIR